MPKQKSNLKKTAKVLFVSLAIAFVTLGGSITSQGAVKAASRSDLQAQANALQRQIDSNNAQALQYQKQAAGLQTKVNQLSAQIGSINAQIELTNVKIAQLQADLDKAQVELERQKGLLKASMRALYKKGGASTVELLAASDSFSQFINDQEYLERLKGSIQDSTEKVILLKQQIQDQKLQQQNLLEQQKNQRDVLAVKQQEQQVLLDQTKGQESLYRSAAEQLRQQQAAVNAQIAKIGEVNYGSSTSYPWANYQPWSFDSCYLDPWGMCVRQCVSYTAWKVAHSGRNMPNWGGYGNANQWPSDARAAGIPVDGNPKVGDVAISTAGYYGHAMYVENVNGNGTIRVSQFNYTLRGEYSEMTVNASGLYFIHFP